MIEIWKDITGYKGLYQVSNDGDFTNNRVENLRYDTPSGNSKDKKRHGTNHESNKTHCIQGHPFNSRNTYIDKIGKRKCRECGKIRKRRRP